MDYTLQHVSGPAEEPVSLDEAKAHLLIEDLTLTTAQTLDLQSKIRSARIEAETFLGKLIGTQVWDMIFDTWPLYWWWKLPVEPLISVNSFTYTDEDGNEETLSPSLYGYSAQRQMLWTKPDFAWPNVTLASFAAVRIRMTAGIQKRSDGASPETSRYPDNIRQAILLRVGTAWNLREDMTLGTTMQAAKTGAFESLLGGDRLVVP